MGGVSKVHPGRRHLEKTLSVPYLALQRSDEHAIKNFAGFVRVAYVLECLG